jgi:hypothetical protein
VSTRFKKLAYTMSHKQVTKKERSHSEVLAYYQQKLFDVRAELSETKLRKSARIAELEKETREKATIIAEVTELALRRSARIAALKKEIADKDAVIARLKSDISSLEFRLAYSRPMPLCSTCGEMGHNCRTCPLR